MSNQFNMIEGGLALQKASITKTCGMCPREVVRGLDGEFSDLCPFCYEDKFDDHDMDGCEAEE